VEGGVEERVRGLMAPGYEVMHAPISAIPPVAAPPTAVVVDVVGDRVQATGVRPLSCAIYAQAEVEAEEEEYKQAANSSANTAAHAQLEAHSHAEAAHAEEAEYMGEGDTGDMAREDLWGAWAPSSADRLDRLPVAAPTPTATTATTTATATTTTATATATTSIPVETAETEAEVGVVVVEAQAVEAAADVGAAC